MFRIDKLTDYGLLLLTCIVRSRGVSLRTARDLALESGLPLPTVSRLLQDLLKGGLLVSQRGIKGGYALAKKPHEISIGGVIAALPGFLVVAEGLKAIPGVLVNEAVTVTAYAVPSMRPTVLLGSMNCDLPGSTTRMTLCEGAPPPRATN